MVPPPHFRVAPLDFRIDRSEPLGSGSFGTVYRAKKVVGKDEGAPAVAKTVPKDRLTGDALSDAVYYFSIERYANDQIRMYSDATNLGELCRYVVPYLGYGEHADEAWLFFEYLPGSTLESLFLVNDGTPFAHHLAKALGLVIFDEDSDEIRLLRRAFLRVAFDLLNALLGFSRLGMVHRDMKPLNYYLDVQSHAVRVIDFGSAAFVRTPKYGAVIGYNAMRGPADKDYVAPEMFIDPMFPYEFDVYACAMSLLRIAFPGLRQPDSFRAFAEEFRTKYHSDLSLYASHAFAGQVVQPPKDFITGLAVLKGEDGRLFELLREMLHESPRTRLSPESALVELEKIKARTPT